MSCVLIRLLLWAIAIIALAGFIDYDIEAVTEELARRVKVIIEGFPDAPQQPLETPAAPIREDSAEDPAIQPLAPSNNPRRIEGKNPFSGYPDQGIPEPNRMRHTPVIPKPNHLMIPECKEKSWAGFYHEMKNGLQQCRQ